MIKKTIFIFIFTVFVFFGCSYKKEKDYNKCDLLNVDNIALNNMKLDDVLLYYLLPIKNTKISKCAMDQIVNFDRLNELISYSNINKKYVYDYMIIESSKSHIRIKIILGTAHPEIAISIKHNLIKNNIRYDFFDILP